MATHSSTLAWQIPWMEEPGRLQSMESLGVGHDWVTSLSLSCTGEGNGIPLHCSCLENPRDGGAWWAIVSGVAQSRTWLKRLGSSSSYLLWISLLLFYLREISLSLSLFFFCVTAFCEEGCRYGGTCMAPNKCICPSGFTGSHCEKGKEALSLGL